jgi:hypothetical protein
MLLAVRHFSAMSSKVEQNIAALGYVLPPAAKSVANYVMSTRVGNLIYTGELWLGIRLEDAHDPRLARA